MTPRPSVENVHVPTPTNRRWDAFNQPCPPGSTARAPPPPAPAPAPSRAVARPTPLPSRPSATRGERPSSRCTAPPGGDVCDLACFELVRGARTPPAVSKRRRTWTTSCRSSAVATRGTRGTSGPSVTLTTHARRSARTAAGGKGVEIARDPGRRTAGEQRDRNRRMMGLHWGRELGNSAREHVHGYPRLSG